jgi:CBS domain containing-hemolysin-like protein
MDVPQTITTISIIVATLISFISNLISSLSQDDLDEMIEDEIPNSRRLQKFWLRYDETLNPFLLLETLLLSLALFTYGLSLTLADDSLFSIIVSFVVLLVIIAVLKFASFVAGMKLSKKYVHKFIAFYDLFFTLNKPMEALTDKISLRVSGKNAEENSREEITAMFESAKDEGSLDDDEYRILKNIMNFSEVLVSDVMTPRTVMITFTEGQTIGEVQNITELSQYSRIPVWSQDTEHEEIVGYVLSKDIFLTALKGENNKNIRSITRELNLIEEGTRLDKALEEFLRRKKHMFIVVDEYGGVEGLITMEDVLETILGVEIIDEGDKVADLRVLAKQQRDKRIEKKQ